MRFATVLLSVLLALSGHGIAFAQSTDPVFASKGFQQNRDYFSQAPTEHIDTLTGNMILTYTLLVLPGNGGHDLRFQVTYNSASRSWRTGVSGIPELGDAGGEDPLPIFTDASGAMHKTVSIERDYAKTPKDWLVATSDFWKYDRLLRRLYLPDGTVVSYDSQNRPYRVQDAFDVTSVDNRASVTMAYGDGGCPVSMCVSQHLSGSEVRQVQVSATGLTFMPGDGSDARTWGISASGLVPPVGSGWQFTYSDPASVSDTLTVTNPYGGATTCEFENHPYWYWTYPCPTCQGVIQSDNLRVVKRRTLEVNGQPGPSWTYNYDWGPEGIEAATRSYVTTMTAPDGAVTTYRYHAEDRNGVRTGCGGGDGGSLFPGAPDAPLCSRTMVWPGGEERESYDYAWVPGPAQSAPVFQYYTPEMIRRRITRDGRTYTTEWSFSGTLYGDFHRPNRVTETGELSRVAERSYDYSAPNGFDARTAALMLLGPLALETVRVGSETVTRSWEHAPATGFLTRETTYGISTSFAPDARGNVASVTKGDGSQTSFTHSWGVLKDTVTAAYTVSRAVNADGTVASETRGGRTTGFEYDTLSRIIRTQPPGVSSEAIATAYDTPGPNQIQVTRGPSVSVTTLDGFGRPVEVRGPATTVRTTYDAFGRTTTQSLPFANGTSPTASTTFGYDPLGRLTSSTTADGKSVIQTYDAGTIAIRDQENRTTVQTWTAFGSPDDRRLVSVTDAMANRWDYAYTALGALTRVTAPGGVAREWRYDTPGFPSQLTSETHPESGTVRYTRYDGAGRLTEKIDNLNTVFTYRYDDNGRLFRTTAGDRITSITFEAGTDNRQFATVGDVETIFGYDTAGRLRSRQDRVGTRAPLSQAFDYDGNDNLTRAVYASGRDVRFSYNAANQVTTVTDVTEAVPVVFARDIAYHPSGAITYYRTANNVEHQLSFDPVRYWPTRIQAAALDLQYTNYDGVGNVGTNIDARPGMNQLLHYDPLDRLTGMDATPVYPSVSYSYDAHGNRQTNAASTYVYDAAQRLRGQNGQTFDYDENGNLRAASAQDASFTYTPDNQVATSTVDSIAATYAYDANGWRIAKTSGLTSLYARGVTGQLFTEKRPGVTRDYIYAGSKLLGMVRNKETGAAPEVNQVSATQGGGGVVSLAFSAASLNGSELRRADLERASQLGTCSLANDAGCTFVTVDTQLAPTGLLAWSDTSSLSDVPVAGAYLYTVRVTDANGAADVGALVEVDTTDRFPSPFSFPPRQAVVVNTLVSSDIVQITGIAGNIPVSVAGGGYRICADGTCSTNPGYGTASATITNGAYLQLRTTSAATVNTDVSLVVTVGGGASTWTVTTTESDADPDPFSFSNQVAAGATVVLSNTVRVVGIVGAAPVSVSGAGAYRLCPDLACAGSPAFTTTSASLTEGTYVQLSVTSGASVGSQVSTTIYVGGYSTVWTVTTSGANPFTFTDRTGVMPSSVVESERVQITGIAAPVAVTITGGGAFRVCSDAGCAAAPAYGTAASTINNGQYLQLQLAASAAFSTAVNSTVSLGGVTDTWSVTSAAQDLTPDSFAFTPASEIAPGTVKTSAVVEIKGITGAVPVSISGGSSAKFRVCPTSDCSGVAFQTAPSTVVDRQYLVLQQTSSATNGVTATVTASVGMFNTDWAVTTVADACAGAPAAGTTCSNGSKFAGYSPITGTKMYVTPADFPGAQQFAWPQDFFGFTSWGDGLANTNGLAVVGNHPAAAACYYLTAHGKTDWYLPSPTEMNALEPNRNAIGGFQPDDTSYWTSTEVDGGEWHAGLYHVMGSTFNGYTGMGISMPIRCMRRD